jgi:hypothetical protein
MLCVDLERIKCLNFKLDKMLMQIIQVMKLLTGGGVKDFKFNEIILELINNEGGPLLLLFFLLSLKL